MKCIGGPGGVRVVCVGNGGGAECFEGRKEV